MTDLAVCIGHRAREGLDWRLENTFKTLRHQIRSPKEIVLGDISVGQEEIDKTQKLCERYEVMFVHRGYTGIWNRAMTLNLAIRASTADTIICTDADMLFYPSFLAVVEREIVQTPDALIHCLRHLTPKELWVGGAEVEVMGGGFWHKVEEFSHYDQPGSIGACFAAARSWFYEIGGWDEAFEGYGHEDTDMQRRAAKQNKPVVWIDHQNMAATGTMIAHQWHEPQFDHAIVLRNEGLMSRQQARYGVKRNKPGESGLW